MPNIQWNYWELVILGGIMRQPTFCYEQDLLKQGYRLIAGLDEVGRGSWAGPVVAACVIFPSVPITDNTISIIRDSKTLSRNQRVKARDYLVTRTHWNIGQSSTEEIDELGISQATRLAMIRALKDFSHRPNYLLIDGRDTIETIIPQLSIIDGDSLSLSVAAASIIAKVTRDALMATLHEQYPQYGFDTHVGYGTKRHRAALAQFGPCPLHRLSYAPLKKLALSTRSLHQEMV